MPSSPHPVACRLDDYVAADGTTVFEGGVRSMIQRKRAGFALSAVVLSLVVGLAFGCSPQTGSQTPVAQPDAGSQTDTAASSESTSSTQEPSLHTPTYKINGKEIAVIKTSKGTIKTKFFSKDAPIASANFIEPVSYTHLTLPTN
jgi:hypothetical protein